MKITSVILILFLAYTIQGQTPSNMVFVKGGTFVPLYSLDSGKVNVATFYMDKYPVTNQQYANFIIQNPQWEKTKVKAIFADKNYLKHWQLNNKIGKDSLVLKNTPVVNVSWFAAKKYCECQGKRLPTVNEWEYVALASETKYNAGSDMKFYQKILDWYGKPNPQQLPEVGKGFKNYYGIYDIHGLVWEWTLDFLSALSVKDSRDGNNLDKNEFCGAGSKGTKTPSNYAAFMRYAMRSSLKAAYCQPNLGFRCVKDIKK